MNEQDQLMKSSFQTRQDHWGKLVSYFCITVIGLLVISIIYFIAARGLNMFIKDGVSLKDFLTGMTWDPTVTDAHGKPEVGAWPMIFTSFAVTILATLVATPLALAVAIFMTELAPKKA
ncbi:MAG: phosphate ABC transporter permease subunit PstC, partial [Limosilactobacillus mucosae]